MVLVAIEKNRLNAEIAFHIGENVVRTTQKPFECGSLVADQPHFESMFLAICLMLDLFDLIQWVFLFY